MLRRALLLSCFALLSQGCVGPDGSLDLSNIDPTTFGGNAFPFPSNSGGPTTVIQATLQPLFTSAPNWNQYLDSGAYTNLWDVPNPGTYASLCTPTSTACFHSGEIRELILPNTNCTATMLANDSLGAFQWSPCNQDGSSAVFYSTRLLKGKGLLNLLDSTTEYSTYKNLIVNVIDNGATIATTGSVSWQISNPLNVISACGSGELSDTSPGIYVLNASCSLGFVFNNNTSALLVPTGAQLSNSSTGAVLTADNHNFVWFEGALVGEPSNAALVSMALTNYSRLNLVSASTSATGGIDAVSISGGVHNILSGFSSNALIMLTYNGSTDSAYNHFENIRSRGVSLSQSSFNTFDGVLVSSSSSGPGVYLNSSNHNTFTQLISVDNAQGIELYSSENNTLGFVTLSNNESASLIDYYGEGNTIFQVLAYDLGGLAEDDFSFANLTGAETLAQVASVPANLFAVTMNSTDTTDVNVVDNLYDYGSCQLQVGGSTSSACSSLAGTYTAAAITNTANPFFTPSSPATEAGSQANTDFSLGPWNSWESSSAAACTSSSSSCIARDWRLAVSSFFTQINGSFAGNCPQEAGKTITIPSTGQVVYVNALNVGGGLCVEDGIQKDCVYAPNMGAYQGEGAVNLSVNCTQSFSSSVIMHVFPQVGASASSGASDISPSN